jgi:hypothetical protein
VNEDEITEPDLRPESLRSVRLGHGANCSSIGSVVDTLFASAVIGSAVLAAVMAAMKREPITVIPPPAPDPRNPGERGASSGESVP